MKYDEFPQRTVVGGTETRIESGPIILNPENRDKNDPDWPGVFFRGDDAAHYAVHLEIALLELGDKDLISTSVLRGLLSDLASARVG